MKRILLGALIIPAFSFAQLTYQDFKYIADNTPQKSIDLLKSKGVEYESSDKNQNSDETTVRFIKYNNSARSSINFYIILSFLPYSKTIINYADFSNSSDIEKVVKKLGYKLINTSYEGELCNFYESSNYTVDICEKPLSKDNYNLSTEIYKSIRFVSKDFVDNEKLDEYINKKNK